MEDPCGVSSPTDFISRLTVVRRDSSTVSSPFTGTRASSLTECNSLVYVFKLMTCEEYYRSHPDSGVATRCNLPEIEAGAARAVALLGASTTVFGVMNLFLTGWWMKRFGIKSALLISVFWPAVRLAIQNVGVMVGAGPGIILVQASQVITIVGGPAGYQLALNSFAAEVVNPEARTGTLGRLSGCSMFGTAIGFLAGGLLSDAFDISTPFKVTLVLFLFSFVYVWLCLPRTYAKMSPEALKKTQSLSAFFEPLRLFVPQKWVLQNGLVQTEYGVLFLGMGAFLGVLATGYISTLLQLYSTDVFFFGTKENGWLISINCLVRGLFLTLAFPKIISKGRKVLDHRQKTKEKVSREQSRIPDFPTEPEEFMPAPRDAQNQPVEPPKPESDKEESFAFDLVFTKYSILADGILTGAATFTNAGWQMYIVAVVLPLASGTGPAAKGTILQMCSPSQRPDALSAIALVEMVARLSTIGLFGLVFAAFAAVQLTYLTFTCNAAVAFLAFIVLVFARFPPPGSKRQVEEEETHDEVQEQ